jgi:hypothetical protein
VAVTNVRARVDVRAMGADEGGHTSVIRIVLERSWAGWLGLVDGLHFLGKTVTGRSISLPGNAIVQGRERDRAGVWWARLERKPERRREVGSRF